MIEQLGNSEGIEESSLNLYKTFGLFYLAEVHFGIKFLKKAKFAFSCRTLSSVLKLYNVVKPKALFN